MRGRKFVWIDTKYWLDSYEVGKLSNTERYKKFMKYVEENTRYEPELGRMEWSSVRKEMTRKVFNRDEPVCRKCGTSEKLEIDHVVPISLGGGNELGNLQILCQTCNRSKGGRYSG